MNEYTNLDQFDFSAFDADFAKSLNSTRGNALPSSSSGNNNPSWPIPSIPLQPQVSSIPNVNVNNGANKAKTQMIQEWANSQLLAQQQRMTIQRTQQSMSHKQQHMSQQRMIQSAPGAAVGYSTSNASMPLSMPKSLSMPMGISEAMQMQMSMTKSMSMGMSMGKYMPTNSGMIDFDLPTMNNVSAAAPRAPSAPFQPSTFDPSADSIQPTLDHPLPDEEISSGVTPSGLPIYTINKEPITKLAGTKRVRREKSPTIKNPKVAKVRAEASPLEINPVKVLQLPTSLLQRKQSTKKSSSTQATVPASDVAEDDAAEKLRAAEETPPLSNKEKKARKWEPNREHQELWCGLEHLDDLALQDALSSISTYSKRLGEVRGQMSGNKAHPIASCIPSLQPRGLPQSFHGVPAPYQAPNSISASGRIYGTPPWACSACSQQKGSAFNCMVCLRSRRSLVAMQQEEEQIKAKKRSKKRIAVDDNWKCELCFKGGVTPATKKVCTKCYRQMLRERKKARDLLCKN